MKYKVTINEIISKEMEIEADSIEEAADIIEDYYNNGDFFADTLGIPTEKEMIIETNDGVERIGF